jgi:serine/threonine protein phosphatase PrpC
LIGGKRQLSITGMGAKETQRAYDNKAVEQQREVANDHGEEATAAVSKAETEFIVGYVCKKGLKPHESPNQDDFCIYRSEDTGLYGVFDGHGPHGHEVSGFVRTTLPRLLLESPDYVSNPEKALKYAFLKTHDAVKKADYFESARSGSTATLVLHRDGYLYVAHVGDSRAILARRRSVPALKKELFCAEDLTEDHKPELPNEKRRIEQSGGEVLKAEYDIPFRVYVKGQMQPGLAMSRSIGDTMAASVGVSCSPDVKKISEKDISFILLCSDGVWEFISSQEAADIVGKYPRSDIQKAVEALGAESRRRWIEEEHDVVDDITALCICFD